MLGNHFFICVPASVDNNFDGQDNTARVNETIDNFDSVNGFLIGVHSLSNRRTIMNENIKLGTPVHSVVTKLSFAVETQIEKDST